MHKTPYVCVWFFSKGDDRYVSTGSYAEHQSHAVCCRTVIALSSSHRFDDYLCITIKSGTRCCDNESRRDFLFAGMASVVREGEFSRLFHGAKTLAFFQLTGIFTLGRRDSAPHLHHDPFAGPRRIDVRKNWEEYVARFLLKIAFLPGWNGVSDLSPNDICLQLWPAVLWASDTFTMVVRIRGLARGESNLTFGPAHRRDTGMLEVGTGTWRISPTRGKQGRATIWWQITVIRW